MFVAITANFASGIRRDVLNGRDYLVAPLTLIVPGVLSGSMGPLLYPKEELAKNPSAWNGIPIVVEHPMRNGRAVSAQNRQIISSQGIGFVGRAKFNGKLTAEGWFDVAKTRRVDPRILAALKVGKPIELSTGLNTDNERVAGTYNGKTYSCIARNYRPDHLAVLPNSMGACSLQDGCGVLVNSYLKEIDMCDLENDDDSPLIPPTLEDLLAKEAVAKAAAHNRDCECNRDPRMDAIYGAPPMLDGEPDDYEMNCG